MKKLFALFFTAAVLMTTIFISGVFASEDVPGDVNGDGAADNKDVAVLFRYVSNGTKAEDESTYDFNGDGSVDNKDVAELFRFLSGSNTNISEEQSFYKVYLYNSGEGVPTNENIEKYSGRGLIKSERTIKEGMENKIVMMFGEERELFYTDTYDFGIYDEKYDMYSSKFGFVMIGEETGRISTFTNRPEKKESDFTPPIDAHSSRQDFIDYASAALLEYTGVSTEGCDVEIKTIISNTVYKYTDEDFDHGFANFIDQDPDFSAEYQIIFKRKISEASRCDKISITIRNDGEILTCYCRLCDNVFDKFANVNIDAENIKSSVLNAFERGVGVDIESYDITLTAIPDGDDLWVMADVHFVYDNNGETMSSVIQYLVKIV